jgi:hypothetical protein
VGDIFREIDEELRQERFEKLWGSYGRHIIAVGVLLVLCVVGWRVWDHYRTTQSQAYSMQFSTADRLVREGKKEDAAALFANLADRASDGYEYLSRFRQAALRGESGDVAGAVSLYDGLAADGDLDRRLRDAAVVFAVMLQMDAPQADVDALRARLESVAGEDRPWRHAAGELSGVLSLKAGDRAGAQARFKAIADDLEAPQGMRARAAQVLAVIGG